MHIEYSAFILPHIGDKYSQCADRFSCGEVNKCFAIADGVGNSLFPGDWASLLCNDFKDHPALFTDNSHLVREASLIAKWENLRNLRTENLTDNERFIYETGLDKADFAASTFVGLSLYEDHWSCEAIGDSYLFLVDSSYNIIKKIASMDGREFGNYPEYFGSKIGRNNGSVIKQIGTYEDVLFFVLMTDALSDWFIETTQEKRARLLGINSHSDFEAIINRERELQALKDDDTTIVFLKIEQDNSKEISFITTFNQVDDIDLLISGEKEDISRNVSKTINDNKDVVNIIAFPNMVEKEVEDTEKNGSDINQPDIAEIERIAKEYRQYGKKKARAAIKTLLSYIYGTSHKRSN